MIAAVSQVCTLPSSFAEDLDAAAQAGCPHLEVWLTKLEVHLEQHSAESTIELLKQRSLSLVAASFQGGLLVSQGDARKVAFDHFKRRLDLCQRFAIPVLVVVPDFAARPTEEEFARSIVSLTQAAQWAAGFGVKLALEFRGDAPFCNNIATALDLIAECGEPNLGICLDVFHYFKGPSKANDLERLTNENLVHVQLCDVAGMPRELMADADRILPGDGDFALRPIVERLKTIHYHGAVSLETMNPEFWKSKPTQVYELGLTAMNNILKQ